MSLFETRVLEVVKAEAGLARTWSVIAQVAVPSGEGEAVADVDVAVDDVARAGGNGVAAADGAAAFH